jgi:16S rRNA (adenine(1408)-N(1))-methyltransferase
LEKISEKIHRQPRKGGLPNALFVRAVVESLPTEFDGIANQVYILFPWGSLLRAIAVGDQEALGSLRRACSAGALLEVVMALDPDRDQAEIRRLGLPPLSAGYITELAYVYRKAGFEFMRCGPLNHREWATQGTTWAKRLSSGAGRPGLRIVARAVQC